ncbi:MAG: SIS domain-containing protein [Kiritimatiellia bacterium]|jgi:D-sedoheptulose 7-phosphate isomerase|nr:SIS domain-containing protein [Kiritimatiellia bacterium]MDD4173469.1 SIS domain-containing protein [Kiritimatiellia bacterium]MDD4441514.1 SIS domain-containing protein [Kiritimatiellia bacterium]MDX9794351.1 SIS domain-containing protein [Kiritimatiellia bacterium]
MNPISCDMTASLFQRYPSLSPLAHVLSAATEAVARCHARDGLVLLCGNGGSAADAAHISGEWLKGFLSRRPPLPGQAAALAHELGDAPLAARLQRGLRAVNLCEASSIITATANDLGPELIFAQQVFALGRPGDILIGLSTSGNAENVTRAMQTARATGLTTIGFTGARPGRMDPFCDLLFKVPETETYRVQELHLPLYHALCAQVEAVCFGA